MEFKHLIKKFFFRQETAQCMFNLPENNRNNFEKNLKFTEPFEQFDDEIKLKSIFPGDLQTYTLKQQCQQIFGSESDACQQNLVRIEINLNLIIFLLFII